MSRYKFGHPAPPKRPILRRIFEGDTKDKCEHCHSSQYWQYNILGLFQFGKSMGCIQYECDNYWDNKQRQRDQKIKNILK